MLTFDDCYAATCQDARAAIAITPQEAREKEAPCGHCGGHGACATNGADRGGVNCDDPQLVCPHCKGAQV